MKTTFLFLFFLFFSTNIFSQTSIIQPESFIIPIAPSYYNVCTDSTKGKLFLTPDSYIFSYCFRASGYNNPLEKWKTNGSAIYYLGKVGIALDNPTYELEVITEARFQTLIVEGNIGINTTTPTEKLELKDRELSFVSTPDSKSWRVRNLDGADRLEFQENGQSKMTINYGGNIGIGDVPNTDKLRVVGDVSYAGTLSIDGKGILSNSTANQLIMHTFSSLSTSNDNFVISNNACVLLGFNLPPAGFTFPPAVFLGQNRANIPLGPNLTKSIVDVTASTGKIQICNTTGNSVTFTGQSFSLIAVGQ